MKKFLLFLCILTSIPSSLFADGIADSPKFKAAREKLVKFDIEGHGISDPQVLEALGRLPDQPADLLVAILPPEEFNASV